MNPRVIFFDAADTLFRVRGSVGSVYRDIGVSFGLAASSETIDRAFHRIFRSAPPLAFPRAKTLSEICDQEREWWRRIVYAVISEVGMVDRFDAYFDEIYRAFRGTRGWELYPETIDVLRRLRREGIRLGIISNFDSRLLDVLDALNINEFFDTITISSREGAAKPDPRIFMAALQKHDCPASSALHVGDSLQSDVGGAMAAGMRAVWIDRGESLASVDGAPSIGSLDGLLALVRTGSVP